jgi:imidazoleglycerol phosphate dehydratase HisB
MYLHGLGERKQGRMDERVDRIDVNASHRSSLRCHLSMSEAHRGQNCVGLVLVFFYPVARRALMLLHRR